MTARLPQGVALRCEKTGKPRGPEPAQGWIAETERHVQNRRPFSPSLRVHAAAQHKRRESVLGDRAIQTRGSTMTSIGQRHGLLQSRGQGQGRMPFERPYPGQLWKHEEIRAIIVAVSPTTVSYEDLSKARAVTKELDGFLSAFQRMKR